MAELLFAKSHEWAKIEAHEAVIGISNYAQEQLGDIVFLELPKVGTKITQFSQFGTIESTKAASELYAPLSGEVIEVNTDLVNNPQWVNEDPFGRGWMIKIKIANAEEIKNLLDESSYKELIEKEKQS
jgi:glycine cleavage system H protein